MSFDRTLIKAQAELVARLLTSGDELDYADSRERIEKARAVFYEMLAERMNGAFNSHLASMPKATCEERQELARHANEELRTIGLAIASTVTGTAANLAVVPGRRTDNARFLICAIDDRERRKTKSYLELPKFRLMVRPIRHEFFTKYVRPGSKAGHHR